METPMDSVKLKLTGQSPLLMNSDRLVNPLDPIAIERKKISSKRSKTYEDHERLAYLEWVASLYHDPDLGPYIPGKNIKACLARGGTKSRKGQSVKAGLYIFDEKIKLLYSGPKEVDALYADSNFIDMRSVVLKKVRIMRCRPIFYDWELTCDVYVDDTLGIEEIEPIAVVAGQQCGLGDFRIEKGGGFGRFSVEVVQ